MGIFSDILLTVDFDRTLTAPDSTIPPRNLEAISYFIEQGGSFTVNTGRSIPMSTAALIPQVPVNAPLLLYNGSAAYDTKTRTLTRFTPIELEPSVWIPELMAQFPQLYLEVQALDAHYLLSPNAVWENYCRNNGCPWAYTTADRVPQPLIKLAFYAPFRGNTVEDMYHATPEELELFDRLTQYLQQTYGDKLELFRPCARILDLHAKGVSKLASARQLQQELRKSILVCVGDAENDIAMLDGADFAFCPADGIVADRYETVCRCADGAIADVIYEKIPAILHNCP